MKVMVIESFFDKTTGEPYNRGDFFSGDKERIAELKAGGFLAPETAEKVTSKGAADTAKNDAGTNGSPTPTPAAGK
jgi:hypothetical protein